MHLKTKTFRVLIHFIHFHEKNIRPITMYNNNIHLLYALYYNII